MASYRAELRQSFDVAPGVDAQEFFENLSADPTTTDGTGVRATTPSGFVVVPFENVLGIVETTT